MSHVHPSGAHRSESQPSLIDRSGISYPIGEPRWVGDDGTPLMVTALPGIGRGDIDAGTRSLWRYRRALPAGSWREVSLGEGCTPLVPARVGGIDLRAC